jgi:uncharacterized protein
VIRPAFVLIVALFASMAMAQVPTLVPVPTLSGHVIDQTATLTTTQQTNLEESLSEFEAAKGSQVVVLIVPTTQPESIEQYSLRVAENWKLGRQKIDDGVVLLIAKNDRKLRIEVGYGLEGALNDATAKRIISETITPYFKQNDFPSGVNAGVAQILQVINGEPLPPSSQRNRGQLTPADTHNNALPVLLIVAVACSAVLRAILGKIAGAFTTSALVAALTWFFIGGVLAAILAALAAFAFSLIGGVSLLNGLYYSGSRGGSSGGGSGFSGGGGGFGGGGASGGW